MKRRSFIFAALLTVAVPAPFIGSQRLRAPLPSMFALIYVKKTREVRRLHDPSADMDSGYLARVHDNMAPDEVMELFPQHAFKPSEFGGTMVRWPHNIAPFIGTGVRV